MTNLRLSNGVGRVLDRKSQIFWFLMPAVSSEPNHVIFFRPQCSKCGLMLGGYALQKFLKKFHGSFVSVYSD